MKRNELLLLIAGLLLVTANGCMEVSEKVESGTRYVITGHPGGAYQPRNVNKYDLENSAKFVLLDKGVERSVTCPNIEERVTDEGRLEVIANVRNRLNRRIEVQINCVFKDDKGFPTNDEAPFKTLILDENAQEGARFISMNNQARTYTIRVREARQLNFHYGAREVAEATALARMEDMMVEASP